MAIQLGSNQNIHTDNMNLFHIWNILSLLFTNIIYTK